LGKIKEDREVWLTSVSERMGQPATLRVNDCRERMQGWRDIWSETLGAVCGKKSHTLVRAVGVRVVEVESVTFRHAI
jgi:hypothetical protein